MMPKISPFTAVIRTSWNVSESSTIWKYRALVIPDKLAATKPEKMATRSNTTMRPKTESTVAPRRGST